MNRLPPLKALRVFEATARQGSMTRAAQELNVTHSAISHQISTLEAALGLKVFDRVGRRLKLTDAGNELLPTVTAAFEGITAATARMARPVNSGNLSISGMPALLSFWVIPRLSKFTARFPGIQLTFDTASETDLHRAGSADVHIVYGEHEDWSGYWFKRLSNLALFPVVSPQLMNSMPIRTVADLMKHVVLHSDGGREWRQWLAAADALSLPFSKQHYLGDARLALEAAIHGHGAAMADSITCGGLLARGQLVAPFRTSVPAADGFYIACRNDIRDLPIVASFIDWLTLEVEQDMPLANQRSAGWGTRRGSSMTRSKT